MHRRQFHALALGVMAVFSIVSVASAQELIVSSPTSGEMVTGSDVTVQFEATEFSIVPSDVPVDQAAQQPDANRPGEGHVHLILDLGPVVIWNTAEPYTFTNVPPGEHRLMVELANNDHSPLSPPVVREVLFRTTASQLLPKTGEAPESASLQRLLLLASVGAGLIATGSLIRRRFASMPTD